MKLQLAPKLNPFRRVNGQSRRQVTWHWLMLVLPVAGLVLLPLL